MESRAAPRQTSTQLSSTIATHNFFAPPLSRLHKSGTPRMLYKSGTPHNPGRRACYTNPGFCTPGFNCRLMIYLGWCPHDVAAEIINCAHGDGPWPDDSERQRRDCGPDPMLRETGRDACRLVKFGSKTQALESTQNRQLKASVGR